MSSSFLESLHKNHDNISEVQALNLAYIGDAVFEVLVRTFIINGSRLATNELHKAAKNYVNAHAQAEMYKALSNHINEEEMAIMRRGRNAKSQTKAKNASINDYRHATGTEALFGYLYMKNDIKRLMELFEICLKTVENAGSGQEPMPAIKE